MLIYDFNKNIPEKDRLKTMKEISDYIKDNIINDFVATDIAICYKNNYLYAEPFSVIIDGALDDLAQTTSKLCNKTEVKKILEQKYHLKITNDNPINIEEMKD